MINEKYVQTLILELMDENPFAIRALLKILDIEFCDQVPTLAVTCNEHPKLEINLSFLQQHCQNDYEIKALICHEFLHVLLRHTEQKEEVSNLKNFAMDAVINAIIHRQLGSKYSAMMSHYYQNARGLFNLLKPLDDNSGSENKWWYPIWTNLYSGKLVVDDIQDLADQFGLKKNNLSSCPPLLGNHEINDQPMGDEIRKAIEQVLTSMNGQGIWRSPKDKGIGASVYNATFRSQSIKMDKWIRTTREILKRYLIKDERSNRRIDQPYIAVQPILSPTDRRAFLRTLWTPLIPNASWEVESRSRLGLANVYLDVSGSMYAEMPYIVSLLNQLRRYIKHPFWAFSNEVVPARIEKGLLITDTSGGTSLQSVIKHIKITEPPTAIVFTDGYIEELLPKDLAGIRFCKLQAILTRDGNGNQLSKAGIAYTQLERLPL